VYVALSLPLNDIKGSTDFQCKKIELWGFVPKDKAHLVAQELKEEEDLSDDEAERKKSVLKGGETYVSL
jgi:hypothetical protein